MKRFERRSLDARERTVLRMHAVDGMTIDGIAAFYRTHRSTAARWVTQARQNMLVLLKQQLMSRLQIDRRELASVMGLMQSEMDLSLRRHFASHT